MSKTLRVISYNIHKGFNLGNRKFVLEEMRTALRKLEPDLVLLQEVVGQPATPRLRKAHQELEAQSEYLADTLWPHTAYGKNAVFPAGHHGNAILSKFPIIEFENIDISTHKRFDRRGILHCILDLPSASRPVHALNLHLGLTTRIRDLQAEKLVNRIQTTVDEDHPLIIAGDFNDWSLRLSEWLGSAIGVFDVHLSKHGRHARTFPSRLGVLQLDRIYARGFEVENVKVIRGKPWNKLSDHLAVMAELKVLK